MPAPMRSPCTEVGTGETSLVSAGDPGSEIRLGREKENKSAKIIERMSVDTRSSIPWYLLQDAHVCTSASESEKGGG